MFPAFFEHHGVSVLGAIFNKMATSGYYDIASCSESIDSYFSQYRKSQTVYGYLPEIDFKAEGGVAPAAPASNVNGHINVAEAKPMISNIFGEAFKQRVAMSSLVQPISLQRVQ